MVCPDGGTPAAWELGIFTIFSTDLEASPLLSVGEQPQTESVGGGSCDEHFLHTPPPSVF